MHVDWIKFVENDPQKSWSWSKLRSLKYLVCKISQLPLSLPFSYGAQFVIIIASHANASNQLRHKKNALVGPDYCNVFEHCVNFSINRCLQSSENWNPIDHRIDNTDRTQGRCLWFQSTNKLSTSLKSWHSRFAKRTLDSIGTLFQLKQDSNCHVVKLTFVWNLFYVSLSISALHVFFFLTRVRRSLQIHYHHFCSPSVPVITRNYCFNNNSGFGYSSIYFQS